MSVSDGQVSQDENDSALSTARYRAWSSEVEVSEDDWKFRIARPARSGSEFEEHSDTFAV